MNDGGADQTWTGEPITQGEWAGWRIWSPDPYELLSGPFYARRDEAGGMVCAFLAERKHMNGHDNMHGGCLMTFADYALFCIATDHLEETAVTAQMSCEFIGAAHEGDLVEASGEVIRAGGSLIFLRGMITTAGRPLLSFSAILKKVRRR
jgi:uncharacterized protein (TIGR00369 family)